MDAHCFSGLSTLLGAQDLSLFGAFWRTGTLLWWCLHLAPYLWLESAVLLVFA